MAFIHSSSVNIFFLLSVYTQSLLQERPISGTPVHRGLLSIEFAAIMTYKYIQPENLYPKFTSRAEEIVSFYCLSLALILAREQ